MSPHFCLVLQFQYINGIKQLKEANKKDRRDYCHLRHSHDRGSGAMQPRQNLGMNFEFLNCKFESKPNITSYCQCDCVPNIGSKSPGFYFTAKF